MLHWHVSLKDPNVPSQAEAGGNAFVEDGEELPNPATNLIREAVQNVLDKRRDPSLPVEVRFTLRDLDPRLVEPWLSELMPHAESSWPQGLAKAMTRPRFLLVEDFNTIGLNGDVTVTNKRDAEGTGNDFFFFWRAQNLSPKQGQGGGSWGVGKTTYYLLSHIGTILGLSNPSESQYDTTVMGRTHLTEHSIHGSDDVYQHFGYGCDPVMTRGVARLPINEPMAIADFKESWKLSRKNESGLSIVIPFLRTDIEFDHLVRSVIEEYPHPISSGELRVVVSDGSSLSTVIEQASLQGVAATCELSSRSRKHLQMSQLLESGIAEILLPEMSPSARPSTELAADLVDEARTALAERGFVKFKLPMKIKRESATGVEEADDFIEVLLQESDEPSHYFIRSGLWVKGEPYPGVPRPQRSDSFLLVRRATDSSKPSLAGLLGRFEGPSHRAWDSALDDDRRPTKYHDAQKIRQFVRRLPSEVARAIALRSESERFSLADDWFSLPTAGQGAGGGGEKGKTGGKKEKVERTGRPEIKAVVDERDRTKAHFTIQGKGNIPVLNIRIGFEQQDHSRSSNLDKWVESDFAIQIEGRKRKGVIRVTSVRGKHSYAKDVDKNVIECRNVDPADFRLVLEGLDPNRGIQWDAAAWDDKGESLVLSGGES